jgi:hypothetical protein
MTRKPYTIGVIGHRDLGGFDSHEFAHIAIHKILRELKEAYGDVRAISALSEGADSLFAQSAILLNIQLESVLPFEDFSDDFESDESRARYCSIKAASDKESRTRFQKRSRIAYRKSMEWIVFKSNIIVALWDGREHWTVGGTWETVSLCKRMKKNTIHINTLNRTINLHADIGSGYAIAEQIDVSNIHRYI